MEEKPNYYAIIPAEVRYDENLKFSEKVLYAEITSLTNYAGECYSSNNYFARLYKTTPQAISKWINNLKEQEYISIDYEYEGKMIKKRIIKLSKKIIQRYQHTLIGYQHTIKENKEEEDKEIYKESIFDVVEKNLGRVLSPIEIEVIKNWDYDEEIIVLAIKEAMLHNAKTIKYIDRVLFNWKQNKLETITDVKNYIDEFSNKKPKQKEKENNISYYKEL